MPDQHTSTWEHHQAELWDRLFQVTQDVVALVEALGGTVASTVLKEKLAATAMDVGTELVRANAAEDAADFDRHLVKARLRAIETDYWLRLAYVLQQRDDIQRDLSGIITQYAAIVDLLHKFIRHTRSEKNAVARHTRGPRIS
jgi:four helix bundle protein